MSAIWIISDTHFGHANILTFCGEDGARIRPHFASATEMDEHMVERWNAVVRPGDKVYHLGDVAIRKEHLAIVKRLHGQKRLVRGNHDIFDTRLYVDAGFKEIYGVRVLAGLLFSHIPVHPASLGRFRGNVHGHIHERPSPEGPYLNVSVEAVNYTPITVEDAAARLARKQAS